MGLVQVIVDAGLKVGWPRLPISSAEIGSTKLYGDTPPDHLLQSSLEVRLRPGTSIDGTLHGNRYDASALTNSNRDCCLNSTVSDGARSSGLEPWTKRLMKPYGIRNCNYLELFGNDSEYDSELRD